MHSRHDGGAEWSGPMARGSSRKIRLPEGMRRDATMNLK